MVSEFTIIQRLIESAWAERVKNPGPHRYKSILAVRAGLYDLEAIVALEGFEVDQSARSGWVWVTYTTIESISPSATAYCYTCWGDMEEDPDK